MAVQMIDVMMIANKPERNTARSISPDFPHRSVTVKTENPSADNSAAISVLAFSVAWAHLGLYGFALAVENVSQQRLLGPIYKI